MQRFTAHTLQQPTCARQQVTELLFLKQTQLERMAAEKAAQQMALERELSVAREEAARVQRCGAHMPSGSPDVHSQPALSLETSHSLHGD